MPAQGLVRRTHVNIPGAKGQSPSFPATNWVALRQAAHADFFTSNSAEEELLHSYLPVMRNYLLRARSISEDHVDDILHSFVADKVLRGGLFKKADPSKGRFRNLLLTSLNNYVATWFKKRTRDPSVPTADGGIPEEVITAPSSSAFDISWARETVLAAVELMQRECGAKTRPDIWEVFHGRVVRPAFEDAPAVAYDDLVTRFNLTSPREVINLLVTAKRMYLRCLREVIGRYVDDEREVEVEVAELRAILMESRNQETWCR